MRVIRWRFLRKEREKMDIEKYDHREGNLEEQVKREEERKKQRETKGERWRLCLAKAQLFLSCRIS